MQLSRFSVSGLFGLYDHAFVFPEPSEPAPSPSVVILHGPNGIGKTTILRMIDGLMRLDFDIFREMPFRACSLKFSNGDAIEVEPDLTRHPQPLLVSFQGRRVGLHPSQPGPADPNDSGPVKEFRSAFFQATSGITFDFVDTARPFFKVAPRRGQDAQWTDLAQEHLLFQQQAAVVPSSKAKPRRAPERLADRVARFISDAQANYKKFFATAAPELFPKIIERLHSPGTGSDPVQLRNRLSALREADKRLSRLGLVSENWDYDQLVSYLTPAGKTAPASHTVSVLELYAEFLESRLAERELLAERLGAFEMVMQRFLRDKTVSITVEGGLRIQTRTGTPLDELQLSSGEYHLLYLMVSTLTTQRRGTVLAIDEPEISMHIAWQRMLVRGLFECASKAQPQFLLATHSPDIAAGFEEYMIDLGERTRVR